VACNKERGLRWKISAQDGDWDKFCADFEEFLPATLAEKCWPKKFRRFQRSSVCRVKRVKGKAHAPGL
jgi:hypothetical protein